MAGQNVDPAALKRAGQMLQDAAEGARKVSPHEDLNGVASSLPGSTSAAASKSASSALLDKVGDWKRDANDLGEGMVDLARSYRTTDDQAGAQGGRQAREIDSMGADR